MYPRHIQKIEFGDGAAENAGRLFDSYVVASMEVPWNLARDILGKPPDQVHLIDSVDFEPVESLAKSLPPVEAVFGIGGGQAVDVAKYLAWRRGLKLVLIPTIVSTDAFATPAAGLRRAGKVEYLGEARVDRLLIDYKLIRTAPRALNVSGAGDILSCHTACFDWKLAFEHGREPLGYNQETAQRSLALVERIDNNAMAIREATDPGLRTVVECELEIVALCTAPEGPGHFRSEEGSEHFFFYNVEYRTRRSFIHGWIVGLGIFLMSRLQDNRPKYISDLMARLGLPFHPRDLKLTEHDVAESLRTLRAQTRADQRWWSIVDFQDIDEGFIHSVCRDLLW